MKFKLQCRETTIVEKIYEVEAPNLELACKKLHFGRDFEAIHEFNKCTDYSYPKEA